MNVFVVAMVVGVLGLVAMALLGMGVGSGGHGVHGGHTGHGSVGNAAAGARLGHAAHGAARGAGKGAGRGASPKMVGGVTSPIFELLATLASPRVLLSFLFGFGLSGAVAERFVVRETLLFAAAVTGGILFEALLVAPFWRFLFRFASRPAETLDHALFSAAQAVTDFDKDGNGLVKIEVDGQVVQLLATLRVEERSTGARVHTGDELVVEEIDEVRQRCRVSTR